jgi:diacylglycerol kinase (ATP)
VTDQTGVRAGQICVLANPTAGRGRHGDLLSAVVERLSASGREIRVLHADSRDAALSVCRDAMVDGTGALVAVGGDGTVHLALQAVAGTGIPFGVVPAGTGNDFAAELGVPAAPLAAAEAVAQAVKEGRTRAVDLGRITGSDGQVRWFGAVLGAGFDAIVNERANRMRFPRGPRRYDVAIFAELMRLRPRRYRITLDGEARELDAILIAIGNTASYGGGMKICPEADVTDGQLDVIIGGPVGRWTFARIKPLVYAGTHVHHPSISTYRARVVELDGEPVTVYADGERVFPLPISVASAPGALTLLG